MTHSIKQKQPQIGSMCLRCRSIAVLYSSPDCSHKYLCEPCIAEERLIQMHNTMKMYKCWRFGWLTGFTKSFRSHFMITEDGEWEVLLGRLYWLRRPKRKVI